MYRYSEKDPKAFTMPSSRRGFLFATAIVGAWAATGGAAFLPSAWAGPHPGVDFMRLSSFVTGRNALDATVGQRFLAGLTKRDATFGAHAAALLTYIEDAKLPDMDAFLALPNTDPALKATATRIVSAWYLGIIGEGKDAELITYADALMYEPTRDILAVPTYGPGPLAWGPKPQSKPAEKPSNVDSKPYSQGVRTGGSNEQF
ncbi:MAG: sugar dehydrogenase complex small subunit [Janthinobacterium lividum]